MASAHAVEISVANNKPSQDSSGHLVDHFQLGRFPFSFLNLLLLVSVANFQLHIHVLYEHYSVLQLMMKAHGHNLL